MDITAAQLELYVSSYADIPYKVDWFVLYMHACIDYFSVPLFYFYISEQVLQQLTSVVNYGGRVTDDKDMRTSDILIADFFQPKILSG